MCCTMAGAGFVEAMAWPRKLRPPCKFCRFLSTQKKMFLFYYARCSSLFIHLFILFQGMVTEGTGLGIGTSRFLQLVWVQLAKTALGKLNNLVLIRPFFFAEKQEMRRWSLGCWLWGCFPLDAVPSEMALLSSMSSMSH